MAAAEAVLRIPAVPSPTVAGRVVEVLRRAADLKTVATGRPRILVGFHDEPLRDAVARAVQSAGFDPVKVSSCRGAMQRLVQSADIDALLIDVDLANPGLDWLLAQVRADAQTGHLPLWLASLPEEQRFLLDKWATFRKVRQEMLTELARLQREERKASGPEAAQLRQQIEKLYAQLTVWYKLSSQSLVSLRAAGVPEEVVSKLHPLIAKEEMFSRDHFVAELSRVLDRPDRDSYQAVILDTARRSGANSGEAEYALLPPRQRVEQQLADLRLARKGLLEERDRKSQLLLRTSGGPAAVLNQEIEAIDQQLVSFSPSRENALLEERQRINQDALGTPPDRSLALRRLVQHYRNVWLIPQAVALDPTALKRTLEPQLTDVATRPLEEVEQKDYAERSLIWLDRMAKGELTGYDIRPAEGVLVGALHNPRLSSEAVIAALDAVSRLPEPKRQHDLAGVVLDTN